MKKIDELRLLRSRVVSAIAVCAVSVLPADCVRAQQSLPAVSANVPAQTQMVPSSGYTFPAKETLTFSVDWRVFTAGSAVFHLDTQGTQVKVTATADTLGAVNMLYPVVDGFQSSFDSKTGCSAGFSKQTQEGRRKINLDLTLDYAAGKQRLVERNLVKGTTKQQEALIPQCVTDSLSAIFYAASLPIVVGQSTQVLLADAMRTVPVTMRAEAKEEIKTPAGTFQTIRVQPTADAGVVKNRGNIWIWYTDDSRHMPVQIRAKLFFGTITFHLQSFESN